MDALREKIRTKIGRRYHLSLQEIIREINPILRGWRNFFKVGNSERHFYRLDRFVMNRLRIFVKRKHNDPCRGMRDVSVELFERLGLFLWLLVNCFSDTGCPTRRLRMLASRAFQPCVVLDT
jgi:hypothetical protein